MNALSHQLSFEEFMQQSDSRDYLGAALCAGTGFQGGRIRIYVACFHLNDKDLRAYIKDEYSTGSQIFAYGLVSYDRKGVKLSICEKDCIRRRFEEYSWSQVADKIRAMIIEDRYLTDCERKKLEAMQVANGGQFPELMIREGYWIKENGIVKYVDEW